MTYAFNWAATLCAAFILTTVSSAKQPDGANGAQNYDQNV